MIKVVAQNTVKKEKIDEFIALAEKLVEATNKHDKGCIHYELYQDLDNPQLLTFIEEWESMEALDQHMAADHFKELVPQLGAFADGPKELHIYKKAY
jgi:quinol monooxygenase YgiN